MELQESSWSILIGTVTALLAVAPMVFLLPPVTPRESMEVFAGLLVFSFIGAAVWWFLIERSHQLQYFRGVVYGISVLTLWFCALGVIDLARESGTRVRIPELADQFGVVLFMLLLAIPVVIPLIAGLGVGLVFVRKSLSNTN